jgi:Family of unknown function (DUF5808)
MSKKKRPSRLSGLLRLVSLVLTAWAVTQELRKPREARTWHGTVGELVPYDFRPPTMQRLRERLWAPADPRLIQPTAFGVGWTLNLGRLVAVLRGKARSRTV